MTETRYKFLREVNGKIKSDSGNITWKIGISGRIKKK